jgi:ferredoxin
MEGNGPANGKQKHFGVIGISENAYALDHAVAKKLNVKEKYAYILNESMRRKLIPDYKINGDWEGGKIKLPITAPIFETFTNLSRAVQRVPEINVDKCISCRICENSCPAGAITIDNHSIDYDKCIRCYVCHEVCPEDAIDLKRKIFK